MDFRAWDVETEIADEINRRIAKQVMSELSTDMLMLIQTMLCVIDIRAATRNIESHIAAISRRGQDADR